MKSEELNLAIKIREELNRGGAKLGNASDFIIEYVLQEYASQKEPSCNCPFNGHTAECDNCDLNTKGNENKRRF